MEQKKYSEIVEEMRNIIGNTYWAMRKGDRELIEGTHQKNMKNIQTPQDAQIYTKILGDICFN